MPNKKKEAEAKSKTTSRYTTISITPNTYRFVKAIAEYYRAQTGFPISMRAALHRVLDEHAKKIGVEIEGGAQ